jgi:hypothetical protein
MPFMVKGLLRLLGGKSGRFYSRLSGEPERGGDVWSGEGRGLGFFTSEFWFRILK